jgi:hypothetical protein
MVQVSAMAIPERKHANSWRCVSKGAETCTTCLVALSEPRFRLRFRRQPITVTFASSRNRRSPHKVCASRSKPGIGFVTNSGQSLFVAGRGCKSPRGGDSRPPREEMVPNQLPLWDSGRFLRRAVFNCLRPRTVEPASIPEVRLWSFRIQQQRT